MKYYSKLAIFLLLLLVVAFPLIGDDFEDDLFGSSDEGDALFESSDEDSMFSSGDSFIMQVEETDKELGSLLLTQEDDKVRIGGSFSFNAAPGFYWNTGTNDVEGTFSGSLDSTTFIDARISENVRAYSAYSLSYPLVDTRVVTTTPRLSFELTELFADFTYNDSLFIRAGKQVINWGVGYFYSPADLLNLSDIDPTNATESVEGPVALKLNASLGVDNLYAYVVFPPTLTDPADLAYAIKYEKVLGGTELGFGGYYRYDNPPAAMLTFSSGIGQIALFGEAMVQYGSNKTFITGPGATATYDDRFFFLGTIGGRYTYSASESDFSFSVLAQYFYNGEGYENTDMYDYAPLLIGTSQISISDLLNPGRHYVGTSVSASFSQDLSASVLLLANMTDFSGLVIPSISYSGIDNISISLSSRLNYGADGSEYIYFASSTRYFSPSLSITFGVLNF
jgi:hypothetical protein